MKISGFSLIRNGTQFDYPFLESLRSLLPLVDELIINVGKGDDNTLEKIQSFAREESKKEVKFFESDWQLDHAEKKRGGLILSEQTNLALDHCSGDWCVYLQADEILAEKDIEKIRQAIMKNQNRPEVEGLLFDYIHFYGSYDVIQESRSVYRREIRAVRKNSNARSIGDAQSFRNSNGNKLAVVHSGANIYHYGWVRTPDAMREKTFFLDQLYHGDPTPENKQKKIPHTGDNYRYKKFWGLKPYLETHPEVMQQRIQSQGWHWNLEEAQFIFSWKDLKRILLDTFENLTGYRLFEYKSYRLIR